MYLYIKYTHKMKNRTNIQIEHDTLVRLRNHKVAKWETYNDLIIRLLGGGSYKPK